MKNLRNKLKELSGTIVVLTIAICVFAAPKVYCWDTYEDQTLYQDLRHQGYSREVATDEVWERKGNPDVYGTGGIDGISTYGTATFGGKNPYIQNKPQTNVHTHMWGEGKTTREASCAEEGEVTYTCSCGATRTEKIAKTEHHYVITDSPATCTEFHSVTYTCPDCGDIFSEDFPEEGYSDHIYIPTEDSVDADCIHDGLTKYVCASCGDPKEEVVEALGHEFTKYTVDIEPWCTTPGVKSIHCDRCDEEQENSKVEIEPLGHVEKAEHEIVPATFWKDGMETVYCDRCDEKLREEVLPATGGVFRYVVPAGAGIVVLAVVVLIIIKKKK